MIGPFDHPWLGGLFTDPDLAAILSPEAELARMIRVEAAWTAAKDDPRAQRAARAIAAATIDPARLRQATGRDGVPVPELVRALRDVMATEDHDLLHDGLTSQDVIDTALSLALAEVMTLFGQRLDALDAVLRRLETRAIGSLMAVTRMQPALAITARDKVASWRAPLDRAAAERAALADDLAVLQWGGPVGVRGGVDPAATAARFAAALGLRDPGGSWHTDRSRIAALAAWLSRVATATGKLGQDVAHLALADPDAIAMDGGGGSSAMPHKRNPVAAELLVTLARFNAGQLGTIGQAALQERERSGAGWTLEWMVLPQMLMATGRGLQVATDLARSITRLGRPD